MFGTLMRIGCLKNLTLTRHIEGKRSRGKQQVMYLTSSSKWIVKQIPQRQKGIIKEQILLIASKNKKLWWTMIAHILKEYGMSRESYTNVIEY